MADDSMALVTGATGGVGGEVAAALVRHGWRVRGLARNPDAARSSGPAGVEWMAGDAMRKEDYLAAARGATVVFHGVNPRGYKNWRGLAIPMLQNAIAAAEACSARLIYPGSLYNYAADAGVRIAEDAPQAPQTRKGRIRVEMEAMLQAAATRGVRTMVVRAGDFFGPRAPSSWLGGVMLAKGAPLTSVVTPEVPGALHSWAYLPDLGETIALLADRQALLPAHARFHFAGHPLAGRAMAAAIQRASGGALPVRSFRWLPVYLAAPFVTFCREVIEMRYLWPSSLQLDNAALVALLGHEPHTDLDAAVTTTSVALRAKYAADARRPATAGTRVVQPRPRPSQT